MRLLVGVSPSPFSWPSWCCKCRHTSPCGHSRSLCHRFQLISSGGSQGLRERRGSRRCLLQLSPFESTTPTAQVPEQLAGLQCSLSPLLPPIAALGAAFQPAFCCGSSKSMVVKLPGDSSAGCPPSPCSVSLSLLPLSPFLVRVRIPSQTENMVAIPGPRCQYVAASGLLASVAGSCAGCS